MKIKSRNHLVAANEGSAIAIGYNLTTSKTAAVYLQNSGLGNCVNPILSLAHKDIYSVPICLIIGWRGEPNVKDEPQHLVQGRVTLEQLELMNVPYKVIIDSDIENIDEFIHEKIFISSFCISGKKRYI